MKQHEPKRDSFVFYRSFFNSITSCPEDVQLSLLKAVAEYGLDQVPPTFDGLSPGCIGFVNAIWEVIRPQLDANYKRFQNGCKGGCPSGTTKPTMIGNQNARKQNQNETKTKPNVNDNDNDNDNDNENRKMLHLPFSSRSFVEAWEILIIQPKWKDKTIAALRMCLTQLAKYDEEFAIELMNQAIANNWKGVTFANTPENYKKWKESRTIPVRTASEAKSSIDEIY